MSRLYIFNDLDKQMAFERALLEFYDREHAALVEQYKRRYELKVRAGKTPDVPPSFGLDEILEHVAPKLPTLVRPYLDGYSVPELNCFIEAVAMTAYDYEMGSGEMAFKMSAIYLMMVRHLADCYPIRYVELADLHTRRYELLKRERALRTDIANHTASLERGVVEITAMSKQLEKTVQQGLSISGQIDLSRGKLETLLRAIENPSYSRSEWIRIKSLRQSVQSFSFERMLQSQSRLADAIATLETQQEDVMMQVVQQEKCLVAKRERLKVLRQRNIKNQGELEEVRKQLQCVDATIMDADQWLGRSEYSLDRQIEALSDRVADACFEGAVDTEIERESARERAVREFLATVIEAASHRAAVMQQMAHQVVDQTLLVEATRRVAAGIAEQAIARALVGCAGDATVGSPAVTPAEPLPGAVVSPGRL